MPSRLALLLAFSAGMAAQLASGLQPSFPRSISHPGGGSFVVSPTYGAVVFVGDSAFDGDGTTGGEIEATLSELLATTVVNNAVGGANIDKIYSTQPSCSSTEAMGSGSSLQYTDSCLWSVVIAGMNRGTGETTMQMFGEREVAAGKRVIIVGHPDPSPQHPGENSRWMSFMDEHAAVAAANPGKVWFVDTRSDAVFSDPTKALAEGYYSTDNSHPSPKAGKVFAERIAAIIEEQAGTTPATAATPAIVATPVVGVLPAQVAAGNGGLPGQVPAVAGAGILLGQGAAPGVAVAGDGALPGQGVVVAGAGAAAVAAGNLPGQGGVLAGAGGAAVAVVPAASMPTSALAANALAAERTQAVLLNKYEQGAAEPVVPCWNYGWILAGTVMSLSLGFSVVVVSKWRGHAVSEASRQVLIQDEAVDE